MEINRLCDNKRRVIILDTSFILDCLKAGINMDVEFARILDFNYEIIVPNFVIEELKKIRGKYAKLALELINKKFKVKRFNYIGSTDDLLVSLGLEGYVIATMDKEIKDKLRGKTNVIYIRNKSKLEVM